MAKVTKELLELNGIEGKPLDLIRKVLDTLNARYEVPVLNEGDKVIYEYQGIYLDPFLEPDSVIFLQKEGSLTLITAIEQLSKVKCVAFRTQLNEGSRLITKSDLINDPGTLGDKTAGRILIRAEGKDLYFLFETKPSDKIGQCEVSVSIPDCLTVESPVEQTLDIHLSYQGDNPWTVSLVGKISVWHWK